VVESGQNIIYPCDKCLLNLTLGSVFLMPIIDVSDPDIDAVPELMSGIVAGSLSHEQTSIQV
jgi:hypothetical protein